METLTILISAIGLSLVFIYFLQLINSNFLKERLSIISQLEIYQQFSTVLPKQFEDDILLYKSDASRQHNAWHQWKFYLCFVIAGYIVLILYGLFDKVYEAVMSGLISGFFIWTVGDIWLNKLMNWKLFERGNKSGFDIVPFWLRLVLMALLIGLMFIVS